MTKKIISAFLSIACLTFVYGTICFAAPQQMADGAIFDAEDYANRYPDLEKVYGDDTEGLYQHYLLFGIKENRLAIYEPATTNTSVATSTQVVRQKHWYDGYELYTWYDMGGYYFGLSKDMLDCWFTVDGNGNHPVQVALRERFPGYEAGFLGAPSEDGKVWISWCDICTKDYKYPYEGKHIWN